MEPFCMVEVSYPGLVFAKLQATTTSKPEATLTIGKLGGQACGELLKHGELKGTGGRDTAKAGRSREKVQANSQCPGRYNEEKSTPTKGGL